MKVQKWWNSPLALDALSLAEWTSTQRHSKKYSVTVATDVTSLKLIPMMASSKLPVFVYLVDHSTEKQNR
ncbi:hypothetical protein Bpfe_027089, partial [Biomphalaria pfeifferi]